MKETSKVITGTLILLSLITILAAGVFAQSNAGSITGIVQDEHGAVVPNATITVTNVGTNETRSTQSNGEGYYEIPSLATGVYKVVATASGFQETTVRSEERRVGKECRS